MKRINLIKNGKVVVITGKSFAGHKQEMVLSHGEEVETPFGTFKIELVEGDE